MTVTSIGNSELSLKSGGSHDKLALSCGPNKNGGGDSHRSTAGGSKSNMRKKINYDLIIKLFNFFKVPKTVMLNVQDALLL